MLSLFKSSIQIEEVVNDIIEDHLTSMLNNLNDMLGNDNSVKNRIKESVAFVYTTGIFGIQASKLSKHDRHKFCMQLTHVLSSVIDKEKPVMGTLFLQERLKEYRRIDEPMKWVQAYMKHMSIDDPSHVAFLAATGATMMRRVLILSQFINGIRKSYKFV